MVFSDGSAAAAAAGVEVEVEDCGGGAQGEKRSEEFINASITVALSSVHRFIVVGNRESAIPESKCVFSFQRKGDMVGVKEFVLE